MKKQTAVEWLIAKLNVEVDAEIVAAALELERLQTIDFGHDCQQLVDMDEHVVPTQVWREQYE